MDGPRPHYETKIEAEPKGNNFLCQDLFDEMPDQFLEERLFGNYELSGKLEPGQEVAALIAQLRENLSSTDNLVRKAAGRVMHFLRREADVYLNRIQQIEYRKQWAAYLETLWTAAGDKANKDYNKYYNPDASSSEQLGARPTVASGEPTVEAQPQVEISKYPQLVETASADLATVEKGVEAVTKKIETIRGYMAKAPAYATRLQGEIRTYAAQVRTLGAPDGWAKGIELVGRIAERANTEQLMVVFNQAIDKATAPQLKRVDITQLDSLNAAEAASYVAGINADNRYNMRNYEDAHVAVARSAIRVLQPIIRVPREMHNIVKTALPNFQQSCRDIVERFDQEATQLGVRHRTLEAGTLVPDNMPEWLQIMSAEEAQDPAQKGTIQEVVYDGYTFDPAVSVSRTGEGDIVYEVAVGAYRN